MLEHPVRLRWAVCCMISKAQLFQMAVDYRAVWMQCSILTISPSTAYSLTTDQVTIRSISGWRASFLIIPFINPPFSHLTLLWVLRQTYYGACKNANKILFWFWLSPEVLNRISVFDHGCGKMCIKCTRQIRGLFFLLFSGVLQVISNQGITTYNNPHYKPSTLTLHQYAPLYRVYMCICHVGYKERYLNVTSLMKGYGRQPPCLSNLGFSIFPKESMTCRLNHRPSDRWGTALSYSRHCCSWFNHQTDVKSQCTV